MLTQAQHVTDKLSLTDGNMSLFEDAASAANESEQRRQKELEQRRRGSGGQINKKSAEDFVKGFNESPGEKMDRYKKRFKELVGME